jgi:hypothetical protein
MRLSHRTAVACSMLTMVPLFMGAIQLQIVEPASGSGTVWDCTTVGGWTTGCITGSPVSGALWNKVIVNGNETWSMQRPGGPCGPLYLTATDTQGFWWTQPDGTQHTASTISVPGDYKVEVTVMNNGKGMETQTTANTYTVTSP